MIATPEIDRRVSESVIAVEAARHLSPSGKADLVALRPAPHGAGNVNRRDRAGWWRRCADRQDQQLHDAVFPPGYLAPSREHKPRGREMKGGMRGTFPRVQLFLRALGRPALLLVGQKRGAPRRAIQCREQCRVPAGSSCCDIGTHFVWHLLNGLALFLLLRASFEVGVA